AAAMSSGRRRTDPPNLSTTTGPGGCAVAPAAHMVPHSSPRALAGSGPRGPQSAAILDLDAADPPTIPEIAHDQPSPPRGRLDAQPGPGGDRRARSAMAHRRRAGAPDPAP